MIYWFFLRMLLTRPTITHDKFLLDNEKHCDVLASFAHEQRGRN